MFARRHFLKSGLALSVAPISLSLSACAGTAQNAAIALTTNNDPNAPNGELAAFFARAYDRELEYSPERATSLGDRRHMDSWDDDSEAADNASMARLRASVAALNSLVQPMHLNVQDEISVRLYRQRLERAEAGTPFDNHGYIFNQMFGAQTDIPTFLANNHQVTDLASAEAYIARLSKIGTKLDVLIERSNKAAHDGITPPKFVYDYVLSDSRNLITGAPFGGEGVSPFLATARTKIAALALDEGQKASLLSRAEHEILTVVGPVYQRLIAAMESQKAIARTTDGAWDLPNGAAYYANRLKGITTTDLSADEIHQIGLDNVARIHGEMAAIMAEVGFTGSRREFFTFLENDPRFFVADTPAGKAQYMAGATALIDAMRAKLPEAFNRMPRAPIEVRAVEPFREQSAGLAFYSRPSPDGSRPGIYYVNTSNVRAIPTYQMGALAFHEGIPGHHMQIAIAQEFEGLPAFRKFGGYTAYIEGWGLYSERLAKEMGFYQDPYDNFGRLTLELRRAIRLVVDTGLHHKRWSRQQAIDYILANQPGDEPSARRDIDRYIVMPGQACAYMIGQREILRLREVARTRLGSSFDIRRFHDAVLASGAVPLDVLGQLVGAMS